MAWGLAAAVALRAQESAGVEFDPRSDGPETVWQVIGGLAIVSVAPYFNWWVAQWFIQRRRDRPRWKPLRHCWPTVMLGLAGLATLLMKVHWSGFGEWLFEGLLCVVTLLNVAAIAPLTAATFLLSLCGLTGWSLVAADVPFYWLAWYGIVRFLEWRSLAGALLSIVPTTERATSSTEERR